MIGWWAKTNTNSAGISISLSEIKNVCVKVLLIPQESVPLWRQYWYEVWKKVLIPQESVLVLVYGKYLKAGQIPQESVLLNCMRIYGGRGWLKATLIPQESVLVWGQIGMTYKGKGVLEAILIPQEWVSVI
jgi:hypothetical protein